MNWISEAEAAKLVMRKPRTLRAKVKNAVWPITYTAPEGRKFMYSKDSIEKFLQKNAVKS